MMAKSEKSHTTSSVNCIATKGISSNSSVIIPIRNIFLPMCIYNYTNL